MIGRIIWFTIMAAIAVLVSLLQIDKQSEKSPALAAAVPAPLRNYAQIRIAQAAVGGENAAQALEEAQRLVRRRPVPADYLVLLAAGQAKAGQTESALRTIQIAGKRGWREPAAQEAVLRIALAAGDRSADPHRHRCRRRAVVAGVPPARTSGNAASRLHRHHGGEAAGATLAAAAARTGSCPQRPSKGKPAL